MNNIKILLLFCFLLGFSCNSSKKKASEIDFKGDFLFLWEELKENYVYINDIRVDWEGVKNYYLPQVDTIQSKRSFVLFLEKVLLELYDPHTHLNTNTTESIRLIPSGSELYGIYETGRFFIEDVHPKSKAAKILQPNDEVLEFNDVPIAQAIQVFLGKNSSKITVQSKHYAFNLLLAGNYINKRKILIQRNGIKHTIQLDISEFPRPNTDTLISSKVLDNQWGCINIHNSLGNTNLIEKFDIELDKLLTTKGLILDLRNTESGGNSTVGKAIISRFITQEQPYQKHEIPSEATSYGIKRSWLELVTPRGKTYTKPLVILVNHWTGSMGEGIAIGLHATRQARVIGTKMAGLKGATYTVELPSTKFGVNYTAEKLYHINGTLRENFEPDIVVFPTHQRDVILEKGLEELEKMSTPSLSK